MPFRLKVTVSLLLTLLLLVLIGPLLVPVPALTGTHDPAELAGEDSSFIEADGISIHFVDQDLREPLSPQLSEPLVLLHGYLFNTRSWQHVQPSLAQTGRVISFDRTGFGLSGRPAAGSWSGDVSPYSPEAHTSQTIALLDELGIEQAVLVGHNSGAVVALEVALRAPERVAGLVLAAPAVYRVGGSPERLRPLLDTPHLRRIGPLLMRQLAGDPGGGFIAANWSETSRIPDEALEAYQLNFLVHDWDKGLWEVSKASHEVEFLDRLGSVTVPTLVLAGAADAVVPPEDSQQLAAELPDATFALFDDCGHVLHEECPAVFTETVLGWLLDEDLLQVP